MFLMLTGVAAQALIHVMLEKVTVIMIWNVVVILPVAATTASSNFHLLPAIGIALRIVVKVSRIHFVYNKCMLWFILKPRVFGICYQRTFFVLGPCIFDEDCPSDMYCNNAACHLGNVFLSIMFPYHNNVYRLNFNYI